jgi:hypothetical protein
MSYRPVLSKRDFVRRFIAGEFGNKGPNWRTLDEFLDSRYLGKVHLRSRRPGGWGKYNIPSSQVAAEWKALLCPADYYLAGMAPHHLNVIQGEVQEQPGGLYLRYTQVPNLPMRDALLAGAKDARGIIARELLSYYLCPNSLEWVGILLDRYPGHVIEFSTFSRCWGTLAGHNTVVWEVRLY